MKSDFKQIHEHWHDHFFCFRDFFYYLVLVRSAALRIQNGFTWMYESTNTHYVFIRIRTMTFSAQRTHTQNISNALNVRWFECVLWAVCWYSHRIWIWIKTECVQRSQFISQAENGLNERNMHKKKTERNISYEQFLELG